MSIEPKKGRYCDECGRAILNAVRVHLGNDYCRACYQRTFLPVPCSVCQQQMRAHRHAAGVPVCDPCVRSSRTCLRCGRLTPRAGKLVGKSAVCAACVPYFTEKRPCTSCGRMSARLSRPLFAELENPVCDSCRNKLTHATCSTCRRYRVVAGHAVGATYCGECIPGAETTHPCPECNCQVSGGGLGKCRACVNRAVIKKDAAFVAAEFESVWLRELWHAFVEGQLAGDCSAPQLRAQTSHAADFFRELGRTFKTAEAINAKSLTASVSSKILRAHLLASRFIVSKLELTQFDDARALRSEHLRIANILDQGGDRPYKAVLAVYADWLANQKIAIRTRRMYVRAAENFCAHCQLDGSSAWPVQGLIDYLIASPGQAASLGRFVTYCQIELNWNVRMPAKTLWHRVPDNTKRDLKLLQKIVKSMEEKVASKITTQELGRLFSLALGVSASQLLRERRSAGVRRHDGGAIEIMPAALIGPSHPLYRYAQRWADLTEVYEMRNRH